MKILEEQKILGFNEKHEQNKSKRSQCKSGIKVGCYKKVTARCRGGKWKNKLISNVSKHYWDETGDNRWKHFATLFFLVKKCSRTP